jgi:hypothetical protein
MYSGEMRNFSERSAAVTTEQWMTPRDHVDVRPFVWSACMCVRNPMGEEEREEEDEEDEREECGGLSFQLSHSSM